jgi:seryl-tRNA synthetase
MASRHSIGADQETFLAELIDAGLLIETGAPGLYGRGPVFEQVRLGLDAYLARTTSSERAESLRFPPVLPRRQIEMSGYLKSFPHLAGTVFAFAGGNREARKQGEAIGRGEDWSVHQRMTEVALAPAACYPVYPAIAARGRLPEDGVTVDTGGACVFRHEPSRDPSRLLAFHMRELVRIGGAEAVNRWRDEWQERAPDLLRELGLDARLAVANDPFFGRAGQILARRQRTQEMKLEILVRIAGREPTAIASLNRHGDHFAATFGIEMPDGTVAHSACVGFGEERIALALLRAHGLDPGRWPSQVRKEIGLN